MSGADLLVRPRGRILLFAKAPIPGQAKTRLIPALGAIGAARLHERLLRETVARLSMLPDAPLEIWCAPDCSHPVFKDLALAHPVQLHRQCTGDLGARLLAAAADGLRRTEKVMLIGCDCPALGVRQLGQAFGWLQLSEVDAVLGPAADGGYVLLGLRRTEPSLFADMPWGSDHVAAMTRNRMAALGWRWRELPLLRDVDRPEDLDWYRERTLPGSETAFQDEFQHQLGAKICQDQDGEPAQRPDDGLAAAPTPDPSPEQQPAEDHPGQDRQHGFVHQVLRKHILEEGETAQ